MDNLFLHIAEQLVDNSWAAPPSAHAPNAQYEAMETARHKLNSRLEQCITSESELDDIWLYAFEYAQAASYYYFIEGIKAGVQLHCDLHAPLHLPGQSYK